MDGTVYLPRAAEAIPYARFRLAEVMAIRGILALGTAAILPVSAVAVYLSHGPHQTGAEAVWSWIRDPRATNGVLVIGASFITLIAYGTRMLRRARRALRGDFGEG